MPSPSSLTTELASLVVPLQCAGCDTPDVPWCETCARPWRQPPQRCEQRADRLHRDGEVALPVWSIVDLDGRCHHLVSAWKDSHRRDLDAFLGRAITEAATSIAPWFVGVSVAVVPAPARPASTRRRGIDVPLHLARSVCRGLGVGGADAHVQQWLRISGASSRRSSARQRGRHVSVVATCSPRMPPQAVVLVDDVITTGATMAACAAALAEVNAIAVAGVTLASVPSVGNETTRV